MSGATRPVRADEVSRLWPAVRRTHSFSTEAELAAFRETSPWAVRVSEFGDALVVERWRAHLDALAIRALVAPPDRLGELVDDACAVARSQGFTELLSPLVVDPSPEYSEAGMEPFTRIVALTARAGSPAMAEGARRAHTTRGVTIRPAEPDDLDALVALDAACFDEFWRQGVPELRHDLETSRVTVAVHDGDADAESVGGGRPELLGYASSLRRGAAVTLGRLAVSPEARRQGIARALIADLDAWAAEAGWFGLSLCTQEENLAARRLYVSAGFEEVAGRYVMLRKLV